MRQQVRITLISLLCLIVSLKTQGQDGPLILKTGFGIPEISNVAVGLQYMQAQFVVGFGYLPLPEDVITARFADIYLHLLGSSRFTSIHPWYLRAGISGFREKTPRWIDRFSYLNLRMGRSFHLNKQLAIEFDLGAAFELSYSREEIVPTTRWFSIDFPVLPGIGTRLVYRIGL